MISFMNDVFIPLLQFVSLISSIFLVWVLFKASVYIEQFVDDIHDIKKFLDRCEYEHLN